MALSQFLLPLAVLLAVTTPCANAGVNMTAQASSAGVAPPESSLMTLYYEVERTLEEVLWGPVRSGAAPSDFGCFYEQVPGPNANRIQAAVASGKSLNDMGNYDMCQHANGTQYCTATVGYNNISVTGLKFGFCVAATCSTQNVSDSVNAILNAVRPSIDDFIYLNSATVHCPEPAEPFNAAFYVTMALYALLVILCIAGTWLKWPKPKPEVAGDAASGKEGSELAEPMLDVVKGDDHKDQAPKRTPGCCEKMVIAFDVRTNWRKLTISSVDDRLACLNGVRALSMFWIIYGHTFFNALQANFMNSYYMLPPDGYTTGYAFLMVPGGYFAVDAFFWLGGFLVVYHLLAEIKKKGRGPPVWVLYVFRLVRIVPTYVFFLLTFMGVLKYLGDGPLWYNVGVHSAPCLKNWWTNLLFINNFLPVDESQACMDWSWYLANDMQFFLITPFLIWTYHKSRAAGITLCLVLLAASTGITAWLVIGGTRMPDNSTLPEDLSSSSLEANNKYFVSEVYTKPYCRIQSYLIGILTGYVNDIWVLRDSKPRKLPMWIDLLLTGIAAAVCWVCVFGEQGQYSESPSPWSLTTNVLYNSLTKIAFSVGLGVICMMCVSGSARFINWFLTWWVWNPLARLTFGAYLVHPMLMDLFYTSSRVVFYWDNYFMPVHFTFFVVAAYICSAAQFMMLERPLMSMTGLLKGVMGGAKRKKKAVSEGEDAGPVAGPGAEPRKDMGAQVNVL